jgi:hypothetical protein
MERAQGHIHPEEQEEWGRWKDDGDRERESNKTEEKESSRKPQSDTMLKR